MKLFSFVKPILMIVIMTCWELNAYAADNVNMHISGKVVASPCIVNGGDNNLTVDLGDIEATTLATPGSSSTPVNFNLHFSECPSGTSNIRAEFSGTADPVAGASYYTNTGTAKNVAVTLIQNTTGYLKGTGTSITQSVLSDKTVTMAMSAKAYSSAGNTMPGSINATVLVTNVYN